MLQKYYLEGTWDGDFKRAANYFKIKLPEPNVYRQTDPPNLKQLQLTQRIQQDTIQPWTAVLDLKKAAEDKSLYPLSDTSTFMRIFDAFQRLEQTLQITWDKVSKVPKKLGSKKEQPPVIKDFLT